MRTASQCVGRAIRSKSDYAVMVFADKRFARLDKRTKLPQWIAQFLTPSKMNLSTDVALSHTRTFFRNMGQPFSQEEQFGKSLWRLEDLPK
jgi:DNA excision repair protein ERCC-2